MIRSLSIVGGGRTGRAMGRVCVRAGIDVRSVFCRTEPRAREAAAVIGAGRPVTRLEDCAGADALLVTVSDDALVDVARRLPGGASLVAHTCGAYGHEVLVSGRRAAIHPLRSFADPIRAAEGFAGTRCFWDAEPAARDDARALILAWGGRPVEVRSGGKALYHAAAVFSSNYTVALMDTAEELMRAAGVEGPEGRDAALDLMEAVVGNLRRVATRDALTGPIERGDVRTVADHAAALARLPSAQALYAALARRTIEIALAKGTIDAAAAARLREVLPP